MSHYLKNGLMQGLAQRNPYLNLHIFSFHDTSNTYRSINTKRVEEKSH